MDTGKTARIVRGMFGPAHFATVYAKPEGRPLVDTFVTEVSQDTWAVSYTHLVSVCIDTGHLIG